MPLPFAGSTPHPTPSTQPLRRYQRPSLPSRAARTAVLLAVVPAFLLGLGACDTRTDEDGLSTPSESPSPTATVADEPPAEPAPADEPPAEPAPADAVPPQELSDGDAAGDEAVSDPAPAPAPEPAPERAYYPSCRAAREAGAAPLYRGDPGYRPGLDRDGDGVACE